MVIDMKLYGSATCIKCEDAKNLLMLMGYQFDYIDVTTIPGYDEILPRLELNDGAILVGFLRIRQYLRK